MAETGFVKALREHEEISIAVKGRRSGRVITLPVWFVLAATEMIPDRSASVRA